MERLERHWRRKAENYQKALVGSGALRFAADADHLMTLRSGRKSWFFVDHGMMLLEPRHNLAYVQLVAAYVKEEFTNPVLTSVDSKSSPQLVGSLAVLLGQRQILALNGKNPELVTPSKLGPSDTYVVVDDVFTAGDVTATNVVERLKKQLGAQDIHVLVAMTRGDLPTAQRQVADSGATLHWCTKFEEVIQRILPELNPKVQAGIRAELGP